MSITLVISSIVFFSVLCVVYFDVTNSLSSAIHGLDYRLLRLSVWLPTGVAYAFFYASRYNIASGNVESVRVELGYSSSQFSSVITAGFWTYAITAPLTGMLSDKMGGRRGLLVSSVGAGISNLVLGYLFKIKQAEFATFISLYSLNIFWQGFGTSAVVKVNAGWYTPLERGVFSGIYNVLLTSGYYMALGGCPVVIAAIGWEYVFLIPGLMLIICALAMLVLLKETPEEYYRKLAASVSSNEGDQVPLLESGEEKGA